MKNLKTIITTTIINLAIMLAFNGVDAKEVEKIVEVPVEVEKIVEVPVVTKSANEVEKITATYEKYVDGSTVVEFSDYSYAIFDDKKNEYIFQPACMGDWDMQFESSEQLKMAMETYFDGKVVEVLDTKTEQSAEDKILNPDGYEVIQKELDKVPTEIKKLLIDNGVEIIINEIADEKEGFEIYGRYYWDSNLIEMDIHNYSIENALIHEIGHALDDIFNISSSEKIIKSYENKEMNYTNPHHYSEVREYVAQSVEEYYNNTLDKNTLVYEELNNILGGYR